MIDLIRQIPLRCFAATSQVALYERLLLVFAGSARIDAVNVQKTRNRSLKAKSAHCDTLVRYDGRTATGEFEMSAPISTFFSAWQSESADARLELIASAVSKSVRYDDPRTGQTLIGIDRLNDYVGMFSQNAPGWSATVVHSDTIAGVTRVTVAFGGKGPDGQEMIQHGQYFVEMDGDLIARMVGFVGNGVPES
ncbi:MAG: nuclear transport factor 2 family protein [Pseudomonadota bacterium]